MFEQKLNPISIFRKALFFRTLHHFICLFDLFAFIFLPLIVLPFVLVVHVVVYVVYIGRMSRALSILSAPKGAEKLPADNSDLMSLLSSLGKGGAS